MSFSVYFNVIAAGNPCRVIREITNGDKKYWEEQLKKRQNSEYKEKCEYGK